MRFFDLVKRWVIAGLFLSLSAGLALAKVAEVTLMLNPFDPARATWQSLEDEFNRTRPDIRFRIVWSDISETTGKMPLLVAAKAFPDLVSLADFQLVKYHDILVDLGDSLGPLPEVYPQLLKDCKYGGKLKLAPLLYNVPFIFYRPDLFRKAGLPMPTADWTWDDYRKAAKALTERDDTGYVKIYGTNIQLIWWVEWLSLIRQAGGDMMDAQGQLEIGKPATRQALEFMHDLIHADRSAPNAKDAPVGGFFTGRYAMFYGGHVTEMGVLRKNASFEWDIAPLPTGPAGKATGELAVGGLGIWKDSKNREAALEVIRFLITKHASTELCKAGLVPVREDVAREVFLAGTPETREGYPKHPEVLVDSLAYASSLPKLPNSSLLALNCITPSITKALNNPDRGSLANVPESMQREAENYLKTLDKKKESNPVFFVLQALLLGGLAIWWVRRYLRHTPVVFAEKRWRRYFVMFTAPCMLAMAFFTVGPMLLSFWWAQTDFNLLDPAHYVGGGQYRALLFEDPDFWHSLKLSLVYALFAVPLGLVTSLGAALLLNQDLRHIGVFRTMFYLPSILPVAASSMMWIWFLHPRYGVINRLLALFGIQGPGWLQDPHWALPALVIISLWGFGGPMLIFLAGLKNIPEALYEAAEIDGAGRFSRFLHITLPALAPVLFFNLTMGIISALQIFDVAYIVSTSGGGDFAIGGPQKATYFYVLNLYQKSFLQLNIGTGSAMAWLFFVVVLLITSLNFWAKRFWWKQEGRA